MDTEMASDSIDGLLERYLTLLDEYTKLKSALNDLQTAMYLDIARANFSAPRGTRYGQDFYDDRMQALNRLSITSANGGHHTFTLSRPPSRRTVESESTENTAESGQAAERARDPLRWFGVLTPMPLRSAQGHAQKAIDEIIPKLASVDSEMADTELQIRRARKKRTKADASARKAKKDNPTSEAAREIFTT